MQPFPGDPNAAAAGRRLVGAHFLLPHHAGRSGRELAGHTCDHEASADEDCHQFLHR